MKAKVSMVTLGVADVERAVRFYRDGLGLPTHNYKDGDDMVMFEMDGTWLGLFPTTGMTEDAGASVAAAEGAYGNVCLARNEPSEEAVDATFAEALAAGAQEVKKPQKTFWGGYSGYFADPDGHLWEVCYNPFTDLT